MHPVLYIILGIALFVIGGYCGYLLTRQSVFNSLLEPTIRDSYSRGYKRGFEHGKEAGYVEGLKDVADMLINDEPLPSPPYEPLIAKPMDAADSIITPLEGNEEPQE